MILQPRINVSALCLCCFSGVVSHHEGVFTVQLNYGGINGQASQRLLDCCLDYLLFPAVAGCNVWFLSGWNANVGRLKAAEALSNKHTIQRLWSSLITCKNSNSGFSAGDFMLELFLGKCMPGLPSSGAPASGLQTRLNSVPVRTSLVRSLCVNLL